MKTILVLDSMDYTENMPVIEKTTVRALIEHQGQFLMQKSGEGTFKVPGGGVEPGESLEEALVRETEEETGLVIDTERVWPLGRIEEKRRDIFKEDRVYVCHTLYYRCALSGRTCSCHMTESELEKGFRPVWETLPAILSANREIAEIPSQRKDTLFLRWYQAQTTKAGILG